MANTIKHKRGSGSDPSASDLVAGELAIRTDTGAVFTKKDDGTVAQVTGSSVGGSTGVDFDDNVKARFGTGNDLEIYHNGTNSLIDNNTGDFYIRGLGDDLILRAADDIILQPQGDENGIVVRGNGEVELYYDSAQKLETKSYGVLVTGELQADSLDINGAGDISSNLKVGGELNLIGPEGEKYIDVNVGSGSLNFRGTTGGDSSHQLMAKMTRSGAVQLNYSGSNRLQTKTDGVNITGELECDSLDVDGDADFGGGKINFDEGGNVLDFADNVAARFGTGNDLKIYHDGSNSYIKETAGTGNLRIEANDLRLKNGDGTEDYIKCNQNAQVELYYNDAKKLETKSDGIDVTGEVQCDSLDVDGAADITGNVTLHANLDLQDSDKILVGAGDDLQIYHDGSNSYIDDSGTGELRIRVAGTDGSGFYKYSSNEKLATFQPDGPVTLYHNNVAKLATKSDGVDITGELQCDSLDVDGSGDIAGTLTVNRLIVDDDGSSGPTVQIRTDDGNPWALQISNDTWSSGSNRGLLFYQTNDGTVNQALVGVSDTWEAFNLKQSNGTATNTGIQLTTSREVKLYYQGSNKLTTKSDGVDIVGELQCDSLDVDGNVDITGEVNFHNTVALQDSDKLTFGNSSDLEIYHNGSHSFIDDKGTGDLILRSNTIKLQKYTGETLAQFIADGEVNLRHNDAIKLQTKSDGVDITGELQCDSLDVDGSGDFTGDVTFGGGAAAVNIAANSDIRFANSGTWTGDTASPKIQAYGNRLYILGGSDGIIFRENSTDRAQINGDGHFIPAQNNTYDLGTSSKQWRDAYFDGIVYCDGLDSPKLETTSSGISVTGSVIATTQIQTGNTGSTEPGNGNTNIGFSARENGRFFASSGGSFSCINRNESGGILRFFRSGSHKGIIEVSSSGVSYTSNSDYRLKENVVTLDGAITRVKQLQPKRFNFIEDPGQTVDGFLAHEAQTVVPEAVTGTHNGVETWQADDELPEGVSVGDTKLDSEGNTIPDYQGIDQAKLVPLLTAALQEAIAKIETLETKVAALEAQ